MTGVASPERVREIEARIQDLGAQIMPDGDPLENLKIGYEVSKLTLEAAGRDAYLENLTRTVENYIVSMTDRNIGEMMQVSSLIQADMMAARCRQRTKIERAREMQKELTEMMGAMK